YQNRYHPRKIMSSWDEFNWSRWDKHVLLLDLYLVVLQSTLIEVAQFENGSDLLALRILLVL
ncbi:hypothetical protein ACJX0J_022433, partial [Zea mays]